MHFGHPRISWQQPESEVNLFISQALCAESKHPPEYHTYQHPHHCHASIRRPPTPLVLTSTPSPGPSDALMTPGRLVHNYPVDFYCCRKHPDTRRCRPGTPQDHLCPWCMDPDRTGGRGMRRNMFLWWILLLASHGFVFRSVQGELPFMAGNNAAMLVNWWVGKNSFCLYLTYWPEG